MARETEVYFTDYTKKTNNSKLGRPSANLNYDIRVRVDDKLNTQIEEYAKKCSALKATAIRGILSSFFAQGTKNDEKDNKGAKKMSSKVTFDYSKATSFVSENEVDLMKKITMDAKET